MPSARYITSESSRCCAARGIRLFLDECAAHYLTVEDAVTVGDLLLELLCSGGSVIQEREGL